MERENVLQYELCGVSMISVHMPLNIEPYYVVPFGKEPFGPSTEAAEEIDCKRLAHHKNCCSASLEAKRFRFSASFATSRLMALV